MFTSNYDPKSLRNFTFCISALVKQYPDDFYPNFTVTMTTSKHYIIFYKQINWELNINCIHRYAHKV